MKHADIRNLLPWHVAATLSESERVEVERHLDTCTECRQEVEELRALQSVEVELSRDTPALQSDMLQRALGEIESHEGHKPLRRGTLWNRFAPVLETLWRPTPGLVRAAVVVQFLLLVGLSALYLTRGRGDGFTVLTGPDGEAEGKGVEISVQFQPQVSEEQLRSAIRSWKARITDGPSALGLYTLSVTVPPDDEEAVTRVLEALRSNLDVISFAERKP